MEVPTGIMALMRGDIQASIRGEVARIDEVQSGIRSGDRQLLKDVVREILQEDVIPNPETGQKVPRTVNFATGGGVEHAHMPLLEAASEAGIPTWLHGEAGSGKSTAAERIAKWKGIEFRSVSLCPTTSKSDLLGYRDAQGQYNSTAFREVYANGGVFLFDEIDNAHPSSLALINHALANGDAEFPDGKVDRHPEAIVIAAANTLGKGANAQYVGRAVIDAATRDRFVYIPWDIDEALEDRIVNPTSKSQTPTIDLGEGGVPSPTKWLKTVRENRQAISNLGIRHLCSPRAAIYGAKLSQLGVGRKWLEELCIYKGMGEADRLKIAEEIKNIRSGRRPTVVVNR